MNAHWKVCCMAARYEGETIDRRQEVLGFEPQLLACISDLGTYRGEVHKQSGFSYRAAPALCAKKARHNRYNGEIRNSHSGLRALTKDLKSTYLALLKSQLLCKTFFGS